MKLFFDILFSCLGLLILSPLFFLISIIIKLDSNGPVFFMQKRIGRNFREFKIYKFRTMVVDAEKKGPHITANGDDRITRVGKFLRKNKIDELPQLINILKGDMSFVGPRPEVGKYVKLFKSDYKELLKIRPGITDPASIKYSNEENVLSLSQNLEENYIKNILPAKIKLSLEYINGKNNILADLRLIFKTILKI